MARYTLDTPRQMLLGTVHLSGVEFGGGFYFFIPLYIAFKELQASPGEMTQ